MLISRAEVLSALGLAANASPSDLGLANMVLTFSDRAVKKFVGFDIEQTSYDEFYPDRGIYNPLDQLVEGYEGASGRAVPIERYRQDNRVLQLRNLPVRSVQNVWEYPDAWNTVPPTWPSSALLFQGTDYLPDWRQSSTSTPGSGDFSYTGFLFRRSGVWHNAERSVRVQYTAGWTAAELISLVPEFRAAALTAAVFWFNTFRAQAAFQASGSAPGATTQEGLGGWTIQFDPQSQARNLAMFNQLPAAAAAFLEDYNRMGKYI